MNKIIKRVKKSKNLEYIILSFILIFAFAVRSYKITNPIADWHSWRQADTASVTRTFVTDGINLLFPRYHDVSSAQTGTSNPRGLRFVEFPLFSAVHAILFKANPSISFEVWGRLVSIFSSLVATYILFLLGKKFIGRWGGVLTAFFYAFIPFNIYFTRVILPEPMAVALALISVWLFVSFIDGEKSWQLFVSAAFFALAMLVKPFTFFYGVPIAYLAIKKYGLKGFFKNVKLLLALDLALIPFFLWRIWINKYPVGIPHFYWAFNGDKIRFKPSFWRWIFGERLGHLILGGWGLIPFSFGLLKPRRRYFTQHQIGAGFTHLFLLGMFLYVVILATANVRHDYYQTIVIPAVALILAQGAFFMWETKEFKKLLTRGLLAFSLGVMFLTGALQVREFYKINHPEIVEAGASADRVLPKDALVIAPYNGDTAFLYQTNRWGWPVVDRPLDELIEKGAGYYVSVNFADPQTQEVMERFRVIEKTGSYVIVDLQSPLKQ